MKRSKFLPIGIISIDTLRSIHIVDNIITYCSDLIMSKKDRNLLRYCEKLLKKYNSLQSEKKQNEIEYLLDDILNHEIFYMLQNYCFPYCYYGSSEGDGACFGIFPDINAIDDDIRYNDIPDNYRVDMSDHGNITLYIDNVEIWSVV
jgi:hypothetical protein